MKGFFTSLIYFYFNTEIRYEVLRQVQRAILSNDTVRRSSAGDTLSTRLSTFRRSISRHRHSSIPNRNERRRMNNAYSNRQTIKPTNDKCWGKCYTCICPCSNKTRVQKKYFQDEQPVEQNNLNETSPAVSPELVVVDDAGGVSSPLIVQVRSNRGAIDNDGMTCDTDLMKNEQEDYELLTDENDVTIQHSSVHAEPTSSSSYHTPISIRLNPPQRQRSNSEGYILKKLSANHLSDNKSLT